MKVGFRALAVNVGASFTWFTVIRINSLKLSEPPLAVPPESVGLNWNPEVPVEFVVVLNCRPWISVKVSTLLVVTSVVPPAR